jgi:microcystin-dependent protein
MDFYIGTLMPFPYNFVPKTFLACNGQILPIASYTALYSLLGTYYGGDGRTSFALPHLNSTGGGNPTRVVMGQGAGLGLTPRRMGEQVGTQQVTLLPSELPRHTHGFGLPAAGDPDQASQTPVAGGTMIDPGASGIYVKDGTPPQTALSPLTVAPAGNSLPHDNMQPWMELYWCICYVGIYPPRG